MNIRDLQYFVAVAETRHFGKAAERCHISQPTLSGQIQKLEEELGVVLFERSKRAVQLTTVGAELLTHARMLLEQVQAILQVARTQANPLAGPLRIGAIPTVSPYLMPLILIALRKCHPEMRLLLSEELTPRLLNRLRSHELDAAVLASALMDGDAELMAQPLFDEPFWIAHPRNHPLYFKDEITRCDLTGLEMLLLSDEHCLAQQVMEACQLRQRALQDDGLGDLRAASLETLLQLVGAGFGCTLVPALAIRGPWMTDAGIIARKLDSPEAYRRVFLVYRRQFPRRQALLGLARIIQQQLPNTVRLHELPPELP